MSILVNVIPKIQKSFWGLKIHKNIFQMVSNNSTLYFIQVNFVDQRGVLVPYQSQQCLNIISESTSTLCLLPQNKISEIIYIFLWFWLILLFFLTAIYIIHQLLMVFYFKFRHIEMEKSNFGFPFLINILYSNLDKHTFSELMTQLNNLE